MQQAVLCWELKVLNESHQAAHYLLRQSHTPGPTVWEKLDHVVRALKEETCEFIRLVSICSIWFALGH